MSNPCLPGEDRLAGCPVRGGSVRTVAALFAVCLLAPALPAQTDGPLPVPAQRPGVSRTPSGVPIPSSPKSSGSQKRSRKDDDSVAPAPTFSGRLKEMDTKSITIALDDFRELEFKRTSKTRFFKNGQEVKDPDFKPGDQLSVEGPQDLAGYLVADKVYWEKPASGVASEKDNNDGVVDAWADQSPATAPAPPPAKPDPDDPGPPMLRRGKPADTARQHAAPVEEEQPQQQSASAPVPPASAPAAPPPAIRTDDDLPFGSRQMDPLIRKAANAALDFTESLPDYECREVVARFESETSPPNWRPLDVVTTDVAYVKGKEQYRNIAVNGKLVNKTMEQLGGAWSTGEFGTILIALFAPDTAAEFHFRKNSRIAGFDAREYAFSVARENSHWTVHMGSQSYTPAYGGSVWIDPATARVLRIEMQANGLPQGFPSDHAESATDYQYVRLGDARQYLLPVHAETLGCQRGTNNCSKNTIDFRDYHKFEGQSTIQFGEIEH